MNSLYRIYFWYKQCILKRKLNQIEVQEKQRRINLNPCKLEEVDSI